MRSTGVADDAGFGIIVLGGVSVTSVDLFLAASFSVPSVPLCL